MDKMYKVKEISIGDKVEGDRIVFSSLADLEQAYKDIDNQLDIYVKEEDGTITKLLNRVINTKVYDGTIKLSARPSKKEVEE